MLVFAGDALVVLFDGRRLSPSRRLDGDGDPTAGSQTRGSIPTSVGKVTLRVSIGVATGPVDLVLAGDTARGIFVVGPTTSAMVRLERVAEAGEIVVDDATAAVLEPALLGAVRAGGRLLRRAAGFRAWHTGRRAVRLRSGDRSEAAPPVEVDDVDLAPLVPAPLRPFLAGAGALESETSSRDHRIRPGGRPGCPSGDRTVRGRGRPRRALPCRRRGAPIATA